MEKGRLFRQTCILVWRNFLIKIRHTFVTSLEILLPTAIILPFVLTVLPAMEPYHVPRKSYLPHDIKSAVSGYNFSQRDVILALPDNSRYKKIMKQVISQLPGPPQFTMVNHEYLMDRHFKKQRPNTIHFGVIFNYRYDRNSYVLRHKIEDIPNEQPNHSNKFQAYRGTCIADELATVSKECEVNKYLTSGFLQLQLAVENALIMSYRVAQKPASNVTKMQPMSTAGTSPADPRLILNPVSRITEIQPMSTEGYTTSSANLRLTLVILFVFIYTMVAPLVASTMTKDVETQAKMYMTVMGLHADALWLSWYIVYAVILSLSTIFLTIALGTSNSFKYENLPLIFTGLLLANTSFLAFWIVLASFFTAAWKAGTTCFLLTILPALSHGLVISLRDGFAYEAELHVGISLVCSLFPSFALASFIDQVTYLDRHAGSIGIKEMFFFGRFPLCLSFFMMPFDAVLYFLMNTLIDYFKREILSLIPLEVIKEITPSTPEKQPDVERMPSLMKRNLALKIANLNKSYTSSGEKIYAIKGFSLDIYRGQITCLVGHCRSGKTTLINILTGLEPPTWGCVSVHGLCLFQSTTMPEEFDRIRKVCGMCPQKNLLLSALTCKEHLLLFATIKGVPTSMRKEAVRDSLVDVGLLEEKDTLAANLHSAQKRKLHVAIALIGDSELVFLDEPTVGMDPTSRRNIWSLLKRKTKDRVIFMTTQFMDEADILSDRKAVISRGELCCCGSSQFLKEKLGVGYQLTLIVNHLCDFRALNHFLSSIIPSITNTKAIAWKLIYFVPFNQICRLSDLLKNIDTYKKQLGVQSYTISLTSLEEVYLNLENPNRDHIGDTTILPSTRLSRRKVMMPVDRKRTLFVEGSSLSEQQFQILFKIRELDLYRNKGFLLCQVFLPVLLVISGYYVILSRILLIVLNLPENMVMRDTDYIWKFGAVHHGENGLLVVDNSNAFSSFDLISSWKDQYFVDAYKNKTDIFAQTIPHFIGFELLQVNNSFPVSVRILYNHSAIYSLPVAVNLLSNTWLRLSGINKTIKLISKSFQKVSKVEMFSDETRIEILLHVVLVSLSFLYMAPGLSAEVVRDRELTLRGMLRISGLPSSIYWLTMLCAGCIPYVIISIVVVLIPCLFKIEVLHHSLIIALLAAVCLFNTVSNCCFLFAASFVFTNADTCSSFMFIFLPLCMCVPLMGVSVLEMVGQAAIAQVIHFSMCVLNPVYTLPAAHYLLVKDADNWALAEENGIIWKLDTNTTLAIFSPLLHIILFAFIVHFMDKAANGDRVADILSCGSLPQSVTYDRNSDNVVGEDTDVGDERTKVFIMGTLPKPRTTFTQDLRKTFVKRVRRRAFDLCGSKQTKVAVRNLCLVVEQGDVLGILGPTGAGKTTVMHMMTGQIWPTAGRVILCGQDIRAKWAHRKIIGFCPQEDALWDRITLREHIECFALIKGVHKDELDWIIEGFIMDLQLELYENKLVSELSGETKRKLSYVISVLGDPSIVLLDEPSKGMDSMSKKLLWSSMNNTFRTCRSRVILSTSSVEESDVLCGRVAIMVNGELQCLGATDHLKEKYGSDFLLEVKMRLPEVSNWPAVEQAMNSLEKGLSMEFPNMSRRERFQAKAHYIVPENNVRSLAAAFTFLEQCQHLHGLEYYCFGQNTLEQVYLRFAKKQNDFQDREREENISISSSL